ncbi:hypothetical protein DSM100238_0577 [Bifidobacterium apri]|uniref:Uncharacterized protein n=1 Tax=Bifidobacterium apri TaxID=1769423 RepID=A0A6A2VYF4_9BIFI|nr:hypothetical protein DSM100238_0577 [Bifidobacterium apri]
MRVCEVPTPDYVKRLPSMITRRYARLQHHLTYMPDPAPHSHPNHPHCERIISPTCLILPSFRAVKPWYPSLVWWLCLCRGYVVVMLWHESATRNPDTPRYITRTCRVRELPCPNLPCPNLPFRDLPFRDLPCPNLLCLGPAAFGICLVLACLVPDLPYPNLPGMGIRILGRSDKQALTVQHRWCCQSGCRGRSHRCCRMSHRRRWHRCCCRHHHRWCWCAWR